MKNKSVLFLTQGAVIAALYVTFSYVSYFLGMSSGVIQVRISEAFCVLAAFTPAAIPGLTIGCFLFNFLSGCVMLDVIFGSLATLIGASITYILSIVFKTQLNSSFKSEGKRSFKKAVTLLLPLPTVLANALIVPYVLIRAYGITDSYLFCFATVGAGEFIACEICGLILYYAIRPVRHILFCEK